MKQKTELVHISQTRCWTCVHLRKNLYAGGYSCIQNRSLPDMLPPWFGEKCGKYEQKEVES